MTHQYDYAFVVLVVCALDGVLELGEVAVTGLQSLQRQVPVKALHKYVLRGVAQCAQRRYEGIPKRNSATPKCRGAVEATRSSNTRFNAAVIIEVDASLRINSCLVDVRIEAASWIKKDSKIIVIWRPKLFPVLETAVVRPLLQVRRRESRYYDDLRSA